MQPPLLARNVGIQAAVCELRLWFDTLHSEQTASLWMSETPTFKNPPIVEFVLGVQFSPLTKLSAGHFGLFWKELGEEWVSAEDGPPLPDRFELFDLPKWSQPSGMEMRVAMGMPVGRFILHHRNQDRLIQIQRTRFHFNWRKTGELKPGYTPLIKEFEAMFTRFQEFVGSVGLGELTPNQWEVTYVDSYPRSEYWETPADWSKFLPGLFGSLFSVPDLSLEHRAAEWSFEIVPKRGRLHISARPARWRDELCDSLLVDTTARGPIGKSGLREGFDLGHEMAVKSFLSITSPDARKRWEEIV